MRALARSPLSLFPRHLWVLLAVYCVASLAHFAHNAEYIAFYPNMPQWLTRESVYLAWLAITLVGAAGLAITSVGWRSAGAACLAAYGALGLYGLGHYTLALCSEHTLAMNLAIWFEVIAGAALAAGSIVLFNQPVGFRARERAGA
jgi:hypothetical protein